MARELYWCLYVLEKMAYNNNNNNNITEASPVLDLIKRKIAQVQLDYKGVLQGLLPFKRKSSSEDDITPNGLSHSEQIEMAQIEFLDVIGMEIGKGHNFQLQQLLNPTWCDQCGDFIWGVYKQCLKCVNCQYTCHHKCLPSVSLDCASVISGSAAEAADPLSEETSLSDPSQLTSSQTNDVSDMSSDAAASEKDETDSGYRSGTIPDDKLPKKPSEATLNREELRKLIDLYNVKFPAANMALSEERGEHFEGFIKVTLNLVRPITMSLGARPPSIYEVLTREHIVEQNTTQVAFYMPRDTMKSIHISSDETTKEVIASLLKKFHILDHPRKFAMYEQELCNRKLVKLRRVGDKESPLRVCLSWDVESENSHRLVIQENETGEIEWDAFSTPELNNFLKVLDREEKECKVQLQYKYKVMKRIIKQRLKEFRNELKRRTSSTSTPISGSSSSSSIA